MGSFFSFRVFCLFAVVILSACVEQSEGVDKKIAQSDLIIESMNKRITELTAELENEKPNYANARVLISGIKSDVTEIKAILSSIDLKTATEDQKKIVTTRTQDMDSTLLTVAAREAQMEGTLALSNFGLLLYNPDPSKINFTEAKKELDTAKLAFLRSVNYSKLALETMSQMDPNVFSPEAKSQIVMRKTRLQEDVNAGQYLPDFFNGVRDFVDGYDAFFRGISYLGTPADLKNAKIELNKAKNKFSESSALFKSVGDNVPAELKFEMINISSQVDILATTSTDLITAIEYSEQGNGAAAKTTFDTIAKTLGVALPSEDLAGYNTRSIYIDDLPYGIDAKYANSIREAESTWEKAIPTLAFKETTKENAEIYVSWVKEFGTQTLGHTVYENFVEVGLGDSNCLSKWKPYTYATVLHIATHELGHALGAKDNYNDSKLVMYYQLTTEYETDIDESDVLPAGYLNAYPVCTKSNVTTYSFEVTSTKPMNIYVVPSQNEYELLKEGKTFSHYPSCEGKLTNSYQKTCTLTQGSYIVLDNSNQNVANEFKLKAKEI